jgi:hypothetical protein
MQLIKAPDNTRNKDFTKTWLFLAGSIEMGAAAKWQDEVYEKIKHVPDATAFNPRRDDWDSSWEQSIHNKQFCEQVHWEQFYLRRADVIFFYFAPGTQSPITLLEFGQAVELKQASLGAGRSSDVIVVCPDTFWRKGNIEVMCADRNIPLYNTLDDGVQCLIQTLEASNK